jgi:hypothetical protein
MLHCRQKGSDACAGGAPKMPGSDRVKDDLFILVTDPLGWEDHGREVTGAGVLQARRLRFEETRTSVQAAGLSG